MTITPEVLDAMVAAGVTRDQLVAILKADYAAEQQREEARKVSKRDGAAERQRRKRARDRSGSPSVPPVTPVTPVTRDAPSPSPQENNSTPLTPTPPPSANAPGEAAPGGALPPTEAGSDDGSTKRKPRKPETLIDPNRKPDDADRAFVAERGMPPAVARNEWVKFVAHHAAKGTLMRDWNAAWRTWVMRWQESQPPPGQITPKKSVQTAARDLLAQFRQGAPDEPFLALPSRNRA